MLILVCCNGSSAVSIAGRCRCSAAFARAHTKFDNPSARQYAARSSPCCQARMPRASNRLCLVILHEGNIMAREVYLSPSSATAQINRSGVCSVMRFRYVLAADDSARIALQVIGEFANCA
jgi:hypothetical protein